MLKIAVSGKMAAGKTTLTNLIQQHHELQQPITSDDYFNGAFTTSERLSIAAPVKEVAKNYFLMPEDYKDRPLLQKIGQKFREIRPSVWIDLMIHKSRTLTQQYKSNKTEGCLVCDDVRFPNEVDALKADGWFVIRLDKDLKESPTLILTLKYIGLIEMKFQKPLSITTKEIGIWFYRIRLLRY